MAFFELELKQKFQSLEWEYHLDDLFLALPSERDFRPTTHVPI